MKQTNILNSISGLDIAIKRLDILYQNLANKEGKQANFILGKRAAVRAVLDSVLEVRN